MAGALSRKLKAVDRRWREVRMFARAMESTQHPILAQIIPTRRCNLACTYCNEYDSVSQPVAVAEMLRRIDRLGELRTSIITLSGGEPLLYPQCDAYPIGRRNGDCDYKWLPTNA